MNKKVTKNLIKLAFINSLMLFNISTIFAQKPNNIIENLDGSKTYEYIIMGDKYDDNMNIDESVLYNNYVLNDIPRYDSEMKTLVPNDSEEVLDDKKAFNNSVLVLKSKFDELVAYLDILKDAISDEERDLILSNLPELMNDKIYFDVDYNDVAIDDMKKIYDALKKIYDAAKISITPLTYFEHLGYDSYIYGYNIDFLRANIKSLKNALSRKEIFKIDKSNLPSVKHNDILDNNYYFDRYNSEKIREKYKITKVSELIEDTYYNVEISSSSYGELDVSDISKKLKAGDTIKIIYDEYEEVFHLTSGEYIQRSEGINHPFDVIDYKDKEGKSKSIVNALIRLSKHTSKYIVKVYKNAIYERGKEYFINYYVGDNKIEDNFYDNIKCIDNTFEDIDKDEIVVNELDFDEKGYVKALFFIATQYG